MRRRLCWHSGMLWEEMKMKLENQTQTLSDTITIKYSPDIISEILFIVHYFSWTHWHIGSRVCCKIVLSSASLGTVTLHE